MRLFSITCRPNGAELLQTITTSIRQVVPRSSIRSFKEDFYRVDADVVLLEGEVHPRRKPVSIAPHFRSQMLT